MSYLWKEELEYYIMNSSPFTSVVLIITILESLSVRVKQNHLTNLKNHFSLHYYKDTVSAEAWLISEVFYSLWAFLLIINNWGDIIFSFNSGIIMVYNLVQIL